MLREARQLAPALREDMQEPAVIPDNDLIRSVAVQVS